MVADDGPRDGPQHGDADGESELSDLCPVVSLLGGNAQSLVADEGVQPRVPGQVAPQTQLPAVVRGKVRDTAAVVTDRDSTDADELFADFGPLPRQEHAFRCGPQRRTFGCRSTQGCRSSGKGGEPDGPAPRPQPRQRVDAALPGVDHHAVGTERRHSKLDRSSFRLFDATLRHLDLRVRYTVPPTRWTRVALGR